MAWRESPELVAVIGPNGSGKSSAIYETKVDSRLVFVNPDDIARREFAEVADAAERDYLAWLSCNAQRDALLTQGRSFGFESVGSHVSKVEFIKTAKRLGYTVTLLFVATEDPEINIARIKHRMLRGGHGVSDEKVRSRYHRTLSLLPEYIHAVDYAMVWDNSIDSSEGGSSMRELVRKTPERGIEVLPAACGVAWIRSALPALFA